MNISEIHILCHNSACNNQWGIKQKPYELIESIKSTYNLSYLLSTILAARDINFEEIPKFLSPKLKNTWEDPKKLPDLEKAIILLKKAIEQKQIIGIIGDYDVDGVSSCVIWKDLFDQLGIKTYIWLPNREAGYGPGKDTVKFFTENKIDLLILVDCGSSSYEFIAQMKEPMIIIDHHIAQLDEITSKQIVINPHRKDINQLEQGQFLTLCATALSFLVITQLLKEQEYQQSQEFLKNSLDLVALATVCDIMPLSPLNRALIMQGIKILEEQKRIGLKILIQKSQIKFPITANDIGFYIGPRLNAAGRMKDPIIAFELLNTKSEEAALKCAADLEKLNKERRIIQQYAFEEACNMLEQDNSHKNKNIICLASTNWHAGIIGIVAAMIQEKYVKPAIIGSIQENIIKASARSQILHIGNLIQKAALEEIILVGGGHKHAGGLSCTKEQWHNFSQWLEEQTADYQHQAAILLIDAIIELEQIEDDIRTLAPHGPQHPVACILTKNIIIKNIQETEKYTRITLMQNYKNHTFFLQNRQATLITLLKNAYKENKMINLLLKLSEKGYHNIEDFELVNV